MHGLLDGVFDTLPELVIVLRPIMHTGNILEKIVVKLEFTLLSILIVINFKRDKDS